MPDHCWASIRRSVRARSAAFRDVLVAIGTPGIHTIAGSLSQVDVEAYKSAFVEAYRQGLLGTGAHRDHRGTDRVVRARRA